MTKLLITNGDSAVDLLAAAPDVDAEEILPWRDVLHAGPLVYADTLETFWRQRVDFLAGYGSKPDDVIAMAKARDAVLGRHGDYGRIEIWMEHDLYDQLQLVQVLDCFDRILNRTTGVFLIQAEDFLGMQTPQTIGRFAGCAAPVSANAFEIARHVWQALCAPTPDDVASFSRKPLPEFPFLQAALGRFMEELPGPGGLSRTQRTMLDLIAEGETAPRRLFAAAQALEEAAFMGDAGFFADLDAMTFCKTPLVTGLPAPYGGFQDADINAYLDGPVALTDFGQEVAADKGDFLSCNTIDRWWGGSHLTDGTLWRYDRGRLIKP